MNTAFSLDLLLEEAHPDHAGLPPWFAQQRWESLAFVLNKGLPDRKDDNWTYTPVDFLLRRPYHLLESGCAALTPEDLLPFLALEQEAPLLVFVNGRYAPHLSEWGELPRSWLGSLATLTRERPDELETWRPLLEEGDGDDAFAALNNALPGEGAVLRIPAGTRLESPIQLLFLATTRGEAALTLPRNLIAVEAGALARVIEFYAELGPGPRLVDAVSRVHVARGGELHHLLVTREGGEANHVGRLAATLETGSRLTSHTVILGGGVVRRTEAVTLAGEGAACDLYGLSWVDGKRHADLLTRVEHQAGRTRSRQNVLALCDGESRAAFTGQVVVSPLADDSDARQTSRHILLSPRAEADSRPRLEIRTDRVRCSHGASVGHLDAAALAYLANRGLDPVTARGMLIRGYGRQVIDHVADGDTRRWLAGLFRAALPPEMGTPEDLEPEVGDTMVLPGDDFYLHC